MSNSRRGLLAAGLATAVVGAMGIVWTLNADAAELPEGGTSPAVVVPAAGAEPVPPALLPWGEVPEPVELAKPGANSAAVAAAGADAAAADPSGSLVIEPEYGPKGNGLASARTMAVPPTPPGMAKADDKVKADFYYAGNQQKGETDGSWASLTIEQPKLATGEYHTLAEISVASADIDGDGQRDHTVEVGWHVDPAVNTDRDPHLFVYYWKDGKPQCYNCEFTAYSKATIAPGATLPLATQKRFGIQHFSGVWWVAYNSEWLGYFRDSLFDGEFTKGNIVKWFGEVAVPAGKAPCSEIGNGKPAADGLSARIEKVTMTNGPVVAMETVTSNNAYYSMQMAKDPATGELLKDTFQYGGTGAC